MGDKPVFSTSKGVPVTGKKGERQKPGWARGQGPAKMRLETKGRGGKAVTVLFNLPFAEDEADAMRREMQAAFGCGGTLGEGTIELAGDLRDKIEAHLAKRGHKLVRAGG